VRDTQADSDAVLGEIVEAVCRHLELRLLVWLQCERATEFPQPLCRAMQLSRWRLGAVSCAATLALAGVLAFAAIVAGFAAALSLAIVFAFTGVLAFVLIKRGFCERRFARLDHAGGARGRGSCLHCGCTGEQTRYGCGYHQGLHRVFHVVIPPCGSQA